MRLHRHYVGLYSLLRMALTKNILILSGKNYFSYEISTAIEPFVYVWLSLISAMLCVNVSCWSQAWVRSTVWTLALEAPNKLRNSSIARKLLHLAYVISWGRVPIRFEGTTTCSTVTLFSTSFPNVFPLSVLTPHFPTEYLWIEARQPSGPSGLKFYHYWHDKGKRTMIRRARANVHSTVTLGR